MTYRAQFETFPEFIAAVVRAGIYKSDVDPRLMAAATGLSEQTGADGGFLVPDTWAAGLWERAFADSEILRRVDRQPVTRGNGIVVPTIGETSRADGSRFGGVRMYWLDEAAQITKSKPTLASTKMLLKKLLGLVFVSDELLEDAPALAAALQRMFAAEAAIVLEDLIVRGQGGARILGILNSGALITAAKEAGQASGTIVKANIESMFARLPAASRKNAVWLLHTDSEKTLSTLNESGDPSVYTAPSAGEWFARMKGCPVIPHDSCPALGNAGDLILADLSQYLLAERDPETVSSIHVKFIESETAFRFRFRTDGQPGWSSPVVRRNSSVTESPFITLAARP